MCLPESARLKIERAQEHYDLLRSRVYGYQALNPYQLIRQPDPQIGFSLFEFRIAPPMPAFGIIVGDFAHTLRSALDHVAVALAKTPPEDTSAFFPIFDVDPHKIRDAKARKKKVKRWNELFGKLDSVASKAIQSLQPYARTNGDPRRDPLWVIHELDRVDKHTAITPIGPWIRMHIDPASMSPPPYPVGLVVGSDGTVFRPAHNGDQIAYGLVDDNFDPRITGEIGFSWGESTVVSLNELKTINDYVREVVAPVLAGLFPQPPNGLNIGPPNVLSAVAEPPQMMMIRFD